MADRNNIEDIYQIVCDDFNWIIEDMTQHRNLIKEKMIQCLQDDNIDEIDDYKQKYGNTGKLMLKLENIKQEYVSITKDDSLENNSESQDVRYNDLEDWTDTNPEEVLLFGKKYEVKYWRDILIILLEELIKRNKDFVDNLDKMNDFKGRTRLCFTYDETLIDVRFYKKISNGLYVMVNNNANSIVTLCRKILRISGYSHDELKIRIKEDEKAKTGIVEKLETDNSSNLIKLPKKYASISLDKQLFKTIVSSIIKRKEEYGTEYIEPRKIEEKYEKIILDTTKYTTAYHVVINIIKYLKDSHFIDNYNGTKKGKYIVVDDGSLQSWIENNIR